MKPLFSQSVSSPFSRRQSQLLFYSKTFLARTIPPFTQATLADSLSLPLQLIPYSSSLFLPSPFLLVCYTAVFSVVTQCSSPKERCVTTLKTAVWQTTFPLFRFCLPSIIFSSQFRTLHPNKSRPFGMSSLNIHFVSYLF